MPAWKTIGLCGSEEGVLHRNKFLTPREERFIEAHVIHPSQAGVIHEDSRVRVPLSAREIVELAGLPYTFSSYNGSESYKGNFATGCAPEVIL